MTLKNLFLLTAIIGCGLFATFLKTAKSGQHDRAEKVQQVIFVPAKELHVGTKLEKEKLTELVRKKWVNKTEVPPNAIVNEDELIGKTVTQNLKPDDCFISSDVSRVQGCPLPPPGKHLYTLKLPYECVGPWVQPGREVDVVCTHRPPGTSIVRHVPLLHKILVRTVDYSEKLELFSASNPIICTLTLEVNFEESHKLQEAHDGGASLRLLVRNDNAGGGCPKIPDDELHEILKSVAKDNQKRKEDEK